VYTINQSTIFENQFSAFVVPYLLLFSN